MKMTVFWDVAPCSLIEVYRRLRGAYCVHHQTTWRVIPEDSHLLKCSGCLLAIRLFYFHTVMSVALRDMYTFRFFAFSQLCIDSVLSQNLVY
jgi:hypothetical protein